MRRSWACHSEGGIWTRPTTMEGPHDCSVRELVPQPFKPNWEIDITATNDVLDLELREFGIKAEFLYDVRILPQCQSQVIFRLGSGDDHLAQGEYGHCGLQIPNVHDDSSEMLYVGSMTANLWQSNRHTFGLYSVLQACRAMVFRSSRQSRLTVTTMLLQKRMVVQCR